MGMFHWSERFEIGIEAIDGQHREWFRRLRRLAEAVEEKETVEVLGETLRFAVEYTDRHFQDEERHMERIGYDGLDLHRMLHAAFRSQLDEFTRRPAGDVDMDKTLQLLSRWTAEHILTEDAAYARWTRERRVTSERA